MTTNVLDLLIKTSIQPRKVSVTNGGEYHSPCPDCGDLSRPTISDRFQVWPDRRDGSGYYICRRCGKHGDNIQFLMDFENMTFLEACRELDIKPKSKAKKISRFSTPKLPTSPDPCQFQPEIKESPSDLWLDQAAVFMKSCHKCLLSNDTALKLLADRGITKKTAIKYGLGWNPGKDGSAIYRPRKAWGLPLEKNKQTGKPKPLWLPVGLVVPLFNDKGQVIQIRIRRTKEDMQSFLPELKYLVVAGSCMATMVINPFAKAFVVVEAGLDAILVAQEVANPDVGAATTWNATAKPDANATAILKRALSILVAMDFDNAGSKGSKWWLKYFNQAKRWPVPMGKDPGEAFAESVDIRKWINLGLPPVLTVLNNQMKSVDDQHLNSGMPVERGREKECFTDRKETEEQYPQDLKKVRSSLPTHFKVALSFLSSHLPELLNYGWKQEELFRRTAKSGAHFDSGLAWLSIWKKDSLKVYVKKNGQIEFTFLSTAGRAVTQSAWPESYFRNRSICETN